MGRATYLLTGTNMSHQKRFLTLFITIILSTLTFRLSFSPLWGQEEMDTAVVFAAIGDFGENDGTHTNVANLIKSWNPDFIITQGDNRYDDWTFDEVIGQRYCDFLVDIPAGDNCDGTSAVTNRFFPAIGNHEYDDGGGINEYLDYFVLPGSGVTSSNSSNNERYYDFEIGPVHVFVINSDSREADGIDDSSVQAQWLQTQLAQSTATWQVVTMHHSPYSSGERHGSDETLQWPYADWGADVIISGHNHNYERILEEGIVYYVNGLGSRFTHEFDTPIDGSQVRYNDDFGAMQIMADEESITLQFYSLDDGDFGRNGGLLVDSYTLIQDTPTPTPYASSTPMDTPSPTATSTPEPPDTPMATATPSMMSDFSIYSPLIQSAPAP